MAEAEPDGETATPASRDPEEPATNSKEDPKAHQEVWYFSSPLLVVKEPPEF